MGSLRTLYACFSLALALQACSGKNNDVAANKARLQIRLTDDPANYEAVLIDVQDIKINYASDSANGWQSLSNVKRGVYDLLRLVNDKDTLLADANLDAGRIQQMRLVLGPNNAVRIGGQTYPLQTPSAQQSGLKLNINQQVSAGVLYTLLLDFDAARSVVRTGNGKYILKPVIRTTLKAAGGSIRGYVLPNSFATAVFAIQGPDTVAGTYTAAGAYQLRGLNTGTYQLSFVPGDSSYKKQIRTGIAVTGANITVVDTMRLAQ